MNTVVEQVRIREGGLPGSASAARADARARELPRGLGNAVPIFIERASGAILRDIDGNQFIDFASGIAVTSVGASHPRVVRAVQEQAALFTHTCFLVTEYDGYLGVAQRLNRLTPGDHAKKTALFSTGAEAVENAVKIARAHTGRAAVVVLDHAFHGRTLLAGTMTAKYKPYRGAGPAATDIHRAPAPYPYRWPGGAENAAEQSFARLTEMVETQIGAENVAAIVVEPVQGEGGVIVQPPGYLSAIRDYCTRHGIVMIADEIQAGLARTGAMFAVEHDGVIPDLITTAKALAAGLPLAAVTGRAEIMDAIAPGGLGGTYAGNPIACAAAIAALDVIVEEGLVDRARRIEELTRSALADAIAAPHVGEFRGRGAMLALEIVHPGGTRPDAETAAAIVARCHERGLLVLLSGTFGNVIRLLPPLVIDDDLLLEGMGILAEEVRRADELATA
ncbi:4-aminobutyrate--2-oxoglutarate transaminase [Microbacterium terricola]|uniref:(S)-3-amino-2-methylpropionate transaminase n=1 Tax=Microbacterium terricola TaxID=344163 RepID=A0ABM8E2P2_9MICO|nr:4-aminobutyrate--2-oxoglutarate transaminase [Microbacterium terricola]UYK40065.1 4-aminobutyrate--2-oxoglutarate transaminase [Microbacterium terricola]BDV32238.1 aspartate aminotransferase family protein [Microbacterium terricola]